MILESRFSAKLTDVGRQELLYPAILISYSYLLLWLGPSPVRDPSFVL